MPHQSRVITRFFKPRISRSIGRRERPRRVVHRPAYQQRDGDVIVRLCMCARARVQAHTDAPRLCARVSVCRLADRAALRGCNLPLSLSLSLAYPFPSLLREPVLLSTCSLSPSSSSSSSSSSSCRLCKGCKSRRAAAVGSSLDAELDKGWVKGGGSLKVRIVH